MLLIDRSQSMIGQAMTDASAAARQFVASKPARDRIAVVAVGKKAVQLTAFSSTADEADAALRTIEVDKVRGTALYDGILVSTQALAADLNPTRVLILLTDGQEVSSDASLEQAIASAREAHVAVYAIGIESAELPAGAATAAGREDRRPLRRRQRDEGPEEDLRRPRRGAPPHLAAELRHLGAPRRPDRGRGGGRPRRVDHPRRPRRLEARRLEASGAVLQDRPRRHQPRSSASSASSRLSSCCARRPARASAARSTRTSASRSARPPAGRPRSGSRPPRA